MQMQIGDFVEFHSWQDRALGNSFCRRGVIQSIETSATLQNTYLHICEEKTNVLHIIGLENVRVPQQ